MGPLRGEVSAAALEAYRRASSLVYELMDDVERRRHDYGTAGTDAWSVPPAVRAERVCAWNAFVLQSLGDAIVDADFRESPATAGYVPHETAEQVFRFYGGVEGWLNLAHQARANPAFRLKVGVPAPLPGWHPVIPRTHLRGLLVAMGSMESHASAAMASLTSPEPVHRAWKGQLVIIAQAHASAQTTARYADELCGAELPAEVHSRAEPHVKRAIERLHRVGQLAADPHRAGIDPVADETAQAKPPARLAPFTPSPARLPAAAGKKHGQKTPQQKPGAGENSTRSAVEGDPDEPETIAHIDQTVRDRFGFSVAVGTRIRHNTLGSGEYVGIGSRGSTYMQMDDGRLIPFADRDFVRDLRS